LYAMRVQTNAFGIAEYYSQFINKFVISRADRELSSKIQKLGMTVYETDIMMVNRANENRLAQYVLKLFTSGIY